MVTVLNNQSVPGKKMHKRAPAGNRVTLNNITLRLVRCI